jgi:uncharacterized SAM-binding protein YcdF (DUF218 family)
MGRSLRQWWGELGPGGASTFSLALLAGVAGLGVPVIYRMRAVLDAARRDETGPADAVLVLGRSLREDRPTEVFRRRLEHGEWLLAAGLAPRIVVSGGRTGGSLRSEAEAGRDYLVERGVARDAVLLEDRSRHTLENLYFVRETARSSGWSRLLLVSDPLHLARAAALARGLKLEVLLSPASEAPPRRGSARWLLRAVREGFLLHWYHVGLGLSRAIGSSRMLDRVT